LSQPTPGERGQSAQQYTKDNGLPPSYPVGSTNLAWGAMSRR
jgi:hypothetical protein